MLRRNGCNDWLTQSLAKNGRLIYSDVGPSTIARVGGCAGARVRGTRTEGRELDTSI